MWATTGHERRKCPQYFQRKLTAVGGTNRFGGPNFDIVWGQTATTTVDGVEVLQQFGEPCWVLRQWKAPEEYGTPDMWAEYCPNDPYPYKGRYEVLQPFKNTTVLRGQLVIEHMPLSDMILNLVIPTIQQSMDASYWTRYVAIRNLKEKEEQQRVDHIEQVISDASPRWTGPVSYSRQGCRTSLIDKKIEQIQNNWKRAMRMYKLIPKGISAFKA